jgi:NAD(P)-dependent dehydrogenase (short-subunit alcohol dehydrogenase family)
LRDLEGKTALVTGASGGIGAHFARVLSNAGARVILGARRKGALIRQINELNAAPGSASARSLDVTDVSSVKALEDVMHEVDIVVNNAGVVRTAAALEQSESDWDVVLDTNLKGMFLVSQIAGRAMRTRRKGGSIINVASILGIRQVGGVLPYAVSKAGVIQMTKLLALELARFDVRVNALAPGYIDTELNAEFLRSDAGKALVARIPQRRIGCLDDLNGPLLLLSSDASRYMTGVVLPVDGGHLVGSL